VTGRDGNHGAADRHEADGEGHRRPAAGVVAIGADHGAAERAGDEADTERCRRGKVADERVVGGKERLADHAEIGGIDGEIEEFEAVAEHDGEDAPRRQPALGNRFTRINRYRQCLSPEPPTLEGTTALVKIAPIPGDIG